MKLHFGDCVEVLASLPEASVDAVVTDPPYGLSFMGKRWDYDVPSASMWTQCLRVLKPGGHLLAFAGTRTQHRMAVRIEDAGFEIRDMIAWVYGSGFPKSLDVSKAIDCMDAVEEQKLRRLNFTAWVRSQGVKGSQIDQATGTNMGGHYTSSKSQPAIMTREHLELCRHLFRSVPEWVEHECDIRSVESQNMANRAVVGNRIGINTRLQRPACAVSSQGLDTSTSHQFNITAPATDAAKQWDGWGTALKPALEPITVARKPFGGTVSGNVLQHGTGAMNIDASRTTGKRWPANFIHDGSDDVIGAFTSTASSGAGAARFFYCAKASKRDRDEGLDGFAKRSLATLGGADREGDIDPVSERFPTPARRNIHPTVKPTQLMRYLCRLVTPPGGIVLDPFMGSGSTGKAATLEGFDFVGIERDADYFRIAEARIAWAQQQPKQQGLKL